MHQLTLLVVFLFSLHFLTAYTIPPIGIQSVSEVDSMIRQCFQTLCKEWMVECHWYCDAPKEHNNLRRCKECLSWRGQQCMDCFEL